MSADAISAAAVARARARERPLDALEALYVEHAPRFLRVARAIVRDPQTAEDVVQEAFAVAIDRAGSFRASGDLAAWVWRIVVNTALSRRRRGRLEALLAGRAGRSLVAESSTRDDTLRAHVARLPRRQKLVLFLHYYADLDYDSIGRVLAIAPGTVGKLLYDARAAVRSALVEDADG